MRTPRFTKADARGIGPKPEELKAARRAGFKKKKPKKPKSKSMAALTDYIHKFGAWTLEVRDAVKQDKKNKELEVKRKKLAQVVAGL